MNPYYTDLKDVIDPLSAITTFVQTNSASWEESADILPTTTNYLSTNNVLISSLRVTSGVTITGNITATNDKTSFNQGSAIGSNSFAVGLQTRAIGGQSQAAGWFSTAFKGTTNATGFDTLAFGTGSNSEGYYTVAGGIYSHAEGYETCVGERVEWLNWNATTMTFTFSPQMSSKFGFGAIANNDILKAYSNGTSQWYSFRVVSRNSTTGAISAADMSPSVISSGHTGFIVCPTGAYAHAEGQGTQAIGYASHAEGSETKSTGAKSHAEGANTTAFGMQSHAEGYNTLAFGDTSHAEGSNSQALSGSSHAEGNGSIAAGIGSHAENASYAYGNYSHSEGISTAQGNYSHSEGNNTYAVRDYSHAAGYYAVAGHDRSWIWKGSSLAVAVSTTRADQFMVSAAGGAAFFGNVGIGTDNNNNALTVVGDISATKEIYMDSFVMKSPNGNKWRVTIDNTGGLSSVLI